MNVGVIDIGSPKKKHIGWAIVGPMACAGEDLDEGVCAFAEALKAAPLALGFEAPMFVPMRGKAINLTCARDGEGDRAFSAGAGAAVLVTSTVVVPYVLRGLREAAPDTIATLNWQGWPFAKSGAASPRQLLLFEAFVSKSGKKRERGHIDDAKSAAQALWNMIETREPLKPAVTVSRSFNILGAMMMRTGWETDLDVLGQACLVVKGT